MIGPTGKYISPGLELLFRAIEQAVEQEGGGKAGVKAVAVAADSNERTVSNWLKRKNSPQYHEIVRLIAKYDVVYAAVLAGTGRLAFAMGESAPKEFGGVPQRKPTTRTDVPGSVTKKGQE